MSTLRSVGVAIGFLICLSGCTHTELRRATAATTNTLTDLQYQQVLNNLAMIAWNPAALPNHVVISEGAVQIDDSVEPGVEVGLHGDILENGSGSLGSSRTWSASWSLEPILDADRLREIRALYRSVVHENLKRGEAVTVPATQESDRPGSGWLRGGKPTKEAVYVGRYRDQVVYVTADGVEGLTRFTLLIFGSTGGDAPSSTIRLDMQQFRGPALRR